MSENKKPFLSREAKIGIVTAIALAMLYFGINFLKGINIFTPDTRLYVQYERIDGIVPTTHVLINGYQVGQVSNIIFDYSKEAPITLELTVDKKLNVPKGTVAKIYDTGLMGDKAIELKLGKSNELCHEGDTLTGIIGGGMIDQVVEAVLPPIEALVPRIDSVLCAIDSIVRDDNVRKILANTAGATQELKTASSKMNRIIDNDLPPIMADVKNVTGKLSAAGNKFETVNWDKTLGELNNTLGNLRAATDKMNSSDNTLGLLLNDKAVYNHLDSTMQSANQLLIDLKANPKRYVHFSVFGQKSTKENSAEKK